MFSWFCVLQITDWGRDLPKKKIIITAHVPFRYPYSPSALFFCSLLLFQQPAYYCVWPLRAMTSSVYMNANVKWRHGAKPGPHRVESVFWCCCFFVHRTNKQWRCEGSNDGCWFFCLVCLVFFQKMGETHWRNVWWKVRFFSLSALTKYWR